MTIISERICDVVGIASAERERERKNAKMMYTAHNKKKNLEKCAYSAHRYRILRRI